MNVIIHISNFSTKIGIYLTSTKYIIGFLFFLPELQKFVQKLVTLHTKMVKMTQNKSEKQERKVVHLQIGEHHEYFGSIEQLFRKYAKEDLGFSIFQVRNNLKNKKMMKSEKCIIRVGVLQTKLNHT